MRVAKEESHSPPDPLILPAWIPTYPEFLFNLARVCLWVQFVHVIIQRPDLGSGDGGVAAKTGFQDRIVDKHILLLKRQMDFLSDGELKLSPEG